LDSAGEPVGQAVTHSGKTDRVVAGQVIKGHSKIEGLEFAPIGVMRAYSLRKKEGTLRRAVEAQIDPKPLDLSGLVENE
jgi:hypothetical protein